MLPPWSVSLIEQMSCLQPAVAAVLHNRMLYVAIQDGFQTTMIKPPTGSQTIINMGRQDRWVDGMSSAETKTSKNVF